MASNCTLGIQNLVKTTLNNKPWFEYDQSLGIVNILDSFAKKINKENSHGVAKTTAITINKQINDGYKNIGDIAFVKSNKEGRGYIDIAPTINQIYLINAQNEKEINELQQQLDEEELLKGFYQTRETGNYDVVDGEIVPFFENEANLNVLNNFQEEQKELDKIVKQTNNIKENETPASEIKPGVEELFESNPELANTVYSKILTNSGVSAKNLLSLLEKENIVEKDCSGGKLKAKDGISTLFDKGGKWEIVTDFKNAPTHKSGGKDIFIQGKKVEVEKNELRVENDFGDVAVIPSKYRIEVQDAIKSNCHSCIDGIVESLPKMKDYAGDGTVFPFFGRYKRFKNSLPDNLKNTPEDEYAMRYYWKHSNKPKSFDEAINREQPMFTMEDDGYYHAPSVEPNTLRFLKPKTHPTLQYELDWYNSDNPEAVDFRNKYDLDTSDKFYRYIPKKR